MNSILTVVTPAANYDLVSLEMVKTDQDITDGSLDAKISTIWIPQASSAVATYCKRVLARETVSEQFRDVARQSELILTRYPVASITSVEVDDVALAADEYEFDGPTGFFYRLCNGYRMSWYGEKIMVVYIGGFALNHIEEAFGLLFGLKGMPDEYLEFDTKALLRSAFKDRIEALARSVISGIHSSDEARAEEDLPASPNGVGKEPRVQQQVVPLSYGFDMKPPSMTPAAPIAPPVKSDDEEKDVEWTARDLIATADEVERRAS